MKYSRKTALLVLVICTSAALRSQSEIESISLDGRWEIVFDHDNKGREGDLHISSNFSRSPGIRLIDVPCAWETIEQDYEGVAYYRHQFFVPRSWEGKVIRLSFGAVNYLSEVWLNDEVVGFHEGGFTPFEFRVDEMAVPGDTNVLTMRVVGPIILTDKTIDGTGKLETPSWRGGISGGVWQTVNLLATGKTYIRDVFIQPDITNNSALFEVELDQTSVRALASNVEIEIRPRGTAGEPIVLTGDWNLKPGINRRSFNIDISDAVYWSPDHPSLYTAIVRIVTDGKPSDLWSGNFGMRELTIRDKDFYLNGEPVYIKAAFFEGLYPNGIAYPDTEEMARKEIRLAKEAGFNTIRPWRHPPPPMWLDLADEMGVMVVGSPALECMRLPLSTPYLPARVENEITQAILRDRNRACVVQWELFNELHRPVLKQMMRPMALLTRELDPTRLILDESGGWAYGANMYLPHESEPTKFNDIHTYPGPFIDRRLYDGFLAVGMTPEEVKANGLTGKSPGRNVVPGLMSYISELGYGSLPELGMNNELFEKTGNPLTPAYRYHKRLAAEQELLLKESGFKDLYPEMSRFYLDQQKIHGEANKKMIEAARSNPEVDGYCIHALAAGDWIMGAGLLDLWRNPKSHAYEATKQANQPQLLALRTIPRNVYEGQEIVLMVTGINEQASFEGKLDVQILDHSGKTVWQESIPAKLEQGVKELLRTGAVSDELRGSYTFEARFTSGTGSLAVSNSTSFDVFSAEELQVPAVKLAMTDREGPLAGYLDDLGIDIVEFNEQTDHSIPVLLTGYNKNEDPENEIFGQVPEFVRMGGTVVFLEELQAEFLEKNNWLPFSAVTHRARGLWSCIPHLVHDHPIFDGLASGRMMDDLYENVWAFNTLRDLEGEELSGYDPVVASIGFDWFSADHKMHYSGPGESWWGSDLAVLRMGKGNIIVSQLRLLNQLGKDPVADRIFFNIINYSAKL